MKFAALLASTALCASVAEAAVTPKAPTPRRTWLVAEGGYWQLKGDASSSNTLYGYCGHLMALSDLMRLTPNLHLSVGGGLNFGRGGYNTNEDDVKTDLTLTVLTGVGAAGVTFLNPGLMLSAGVQYGVAMLSLLDTTIEERSLFEVNRLSSKNSLTQYSQFELYGRAMARVGGKFWLGAYAMHTMSGGLTPANAAAENFSGLQAGLSLSYAFDWVLQRRNEERPKPIMPALPEDTPDPMKGLEN